MAVTSTTVWEIRTTGSDTNGGFFDPSSSGTDYSQQDSPQVSLTDVVTNSTTTVTSPSNLFLAAHVGNGINIAGTIFQITAVGGVGTITVDRATGTGTGQTGKIGGALLSPGYCSAQLAATTATANDVYQKTGAYSMGSGSANTSGNRVNSSIGGSSTKPFRWMGYNTTRTDRTNPPVITLTAGTSVTMFIFSGTNGTRFENITLVGNNGSLNIGVNLASNCIGNKLKVSLSSTGFTVNTSTLINCEADTCGTGFTGRGQFIYCTAHGCTTVGFSPTTGSGCFSKCISWGNTGNGFSIPASVAYPVNECTAYNNTLSGFSIGAGAGITEFVNCLSYGNTQYGWTAAAVNNFPHLINCAGGGNTSGNVNTNIGDVDGFITLTANPFTNSAGNDFTINSTAGGGALLRNLAIPTTYGGSSTLQNADVGAAHHPDPTGGSGVKRRHFE